MNAAEPNHMTIINELIDERMTNTDENRERATEHVLECLRTIRNGGSLASIVPECQAAAQIKEWSTITNRLAALRRAGLDESPEALSLIDGIRVLAVRYIKTVIDPAMAIIVGDPEVGSS